MPPAAPPTRPTDGASFAAALRGPGRRIVAEFKARSPSAGEILSSPDTQVESFGLIYRRGHAAAISVVIEEDHFGGKPAWLPRIKAISGLPVLMKDFVVDERQLDFAVSLGADAVLLIARALADGELERLSSAARERGLARVVEAHDAAEIAPGRAPSSPEVLGVNARDLATFRTDLERARGNGRADSGGAGPPRGERDPEPRRRGGARGGRLRGFLVGETLLRSEDPEQELRELRA